MNATLLTALLAIAPQFSLENIRCIDGDTIVADAVLGFDLVRRNQEIRLYAYDAWETSYRRQTVEFAKDELARGKLAKQALEKALGEARVVRACEVPGKRDPYGRNLLCVFVDGKEVGGILREQGHERK